jgi:hypothetical protein
MAACVVRAAGTPKRSALYTQLPPLSVNLALLPICVVPVPLHGQTAPRPEPQHRNGLCSKRFLRCRSLGYSFGPIFLPLPLGLSCGHRQRDDPPQHRPEAPPVLVSLAGKSK